MRIEIGEWRVRSFHPGDAPALAGYANNANIANNLRDRFPHPYRIEDADNWIKVALAQEPETIFAIASATEAIGSIGMELHDDVYRRSAEVGYWLGEPFWGRGIATLALQAITDYAFDRLDMVRVYAHVYETNPASARVLEKAGFQFEGTLRKSVTKHGRIIDQWLYAAVRE